MITDYERSRIVCEAARGERNKKAPLHWDICKAISEGKNTFDIADEHNVDERHVRRIRDTKCSDCR